MGLYEKSILTKEQICVANLFRNFDKLPRYCQVKNHAIPSHGQQLYRVVQQNAFPCYVHLRLNKRELNLPFNSRVRQWWEDTEFVKLCPKAKRSDLRFVYASLLIPLLIQRQRSVNRSTRPFMTRRQREFYWVLEGICEGGVFCWKTDGKINVMMSLANLLLISLIIRQEEKISKGDAKRFLPIGTKIQYPVPTSRTRGQ